MRHPVGWPCTTGPPAYKDTGHSDAPRLQGQFWHFPNYVFVNKNPLLRVTMWLHGKCQNCHCSRSVTVTGVTVSGRPCTVIARQAEFRATAVAVGEGSTINPCKHCRGEREGPSVCLPVCPSLPVPPSLPPSLPRFLSMWRGSEEKNGKHRPHT